MTVNQHALHRTDDLWLAYATLWFGQGGVDVVYPSKNTDLFDYAAQVILLLAEMPLVPSQHRIIFPYSNG